MKKDLFHNDTIEDKDLPVIAKDLATRERVNFVLSSKIMELLRAKASKESIPMSRIIDAALCNYLNPSYSASSFTTLEAGIILSHFLEVFLYISFESAFTELVMKQIQTYFENYTYSRCLFKKPKEKETIVGTKVILFISDDQDEYFSSFLNSMSSIQDKQSIKIFLDGQPIQV